jgi:1,4-dihydroxy-2-naphthoyl-CoA synthase
MELDLYLLLFSTSDRVEGITAFKEKRSPRFEGA